MTPFGSVSFFALLPVHWPSHHSTLLLLLLRRFYSRTREGRQREQTPDFTSWKFSTQHPGQRISPPPKPPVISLIATSPPISIAPPTPQTRASPRALHSACIWVGLLASQHSPSLLLLLLLPKANQPIITHPAQDIRLISGISYQSSIAARCPRPHRLPWPADSSGLVPPLPRHRRSSTPAISVNPQRRQRYRRTCPHPLTKPTSLAS